MMYTAFPIITAEIQNQINVVFNGNFDLGECEN